MTTILDKKKNIETIYPLSPMQQGILFHTLLQPTSGLYVPQVCLTLKGVLDIDRFAEAWKTEIEQHQPLRTAFYWEQRDTPFQIVFRQVPMPWQLLDWRKVDNQSQKLEEFLNDDRSKGFDIKQPPLIRLTLIQQSEAEFCLVWTQHHLVLDGWSVALLLQRVLSRYLYPHITPPKPPAYSNYIAWLKQQDQSAAEQFWRNYLAGFTTPTSLQLTPSTSFQTRQTIKTRLAIEPTDRLIRFAKSQQITINTVIQAAFAMVQSQFSQQSDVVFGATTSGRPSEIQDIDRMIGLFINTLPVRVKLEPSLKIVDLLKDLQQQQSKTLEYEYTALTDIQRWSEVSGSLFESILVFENYPVDPGQIGEQSTLQVQDIRSIEWTNFPLTLLVAIGKEISFELKYDTGRFRAADMEHYLKYLQSNLEQMLTQDERALDDLTLNNFINLIPEDIKQLNEWNDTRSNYPDLCIHDQFVAQANKTPNAEAVRFEGEALSYAELNHRANQFAHYLRSQGIKTSQPVGVCLPRSIALVIIFLGISKAGCAYVPVDIEYPIDRLRSIIRNTKLEVIITTEANLLKELDSNQETQTVKILVWETVFTQLTQECATNPETAVQIDDVFYILHTSGSTGIPKGVVVSHRSISNRLHWMQQQYSLNANDRVLQKTPYSFDVSVWEFFWPLLMGATLVLARPGGQQDIHYLAKIIETEKITTVHFVPSMLRAFLDISDIPNSLRQIFSSGEALTQDLVKDLLSRSKTKLHNLYGPTEAAIDVTYYPCALNDPIAAQSASVPIGRPISNTQIHILNDNHQTVPVGVAGELYIGGVGLATEYVNQPEKTAERFVETKFGRLYRTGDRARWQQNGNLDYLGRLDRQVKLRGFRIELGEIEVALSRHPKVQQSAVILHSDGSEARLVAYVVSQSDELENNPNPDNPIELSEFLRDRLPHYMIPSQFVIMERFPVTSNGKLDWKALPSPDRPIVQDDRLPQTELEQQIAEIWCNVLKAETVTVGLDLFELGGNSLTATRINARLRESLQLDLPLQSVFEYPTIEAMATHIQSLQTSSLMQSGMQSIPKFDRQQSIPLSFAQQRLWFLEQLQPGSTAYNVPGAVEITGNLNITALSQALNQLIMRHEVLRSRFITVNGQPNVEIRSQGELVFNQIDLQHLSQPLSNGNQSLVSQESEIKAAMLNEIQNPFDLEKDLLIRSVLFQCAPDRYIILLTLHHIVTDGGSMEILVQELGHIYRALVLDRPLDLPQIPIQYADFAAWQRGVLQGETLNTQLTYWQQQLAQPRTVLQLPTDFPRSRIQGFEGAVHQFALTPYLSEQLQKLAKSQQTTLFVLMLAAYKILLCKYTGQSDIIVGCPIANRQRVELEGIVGLFVNTLVLRSKVSEDISFNEFLQQLRSQVYQAYEYQDLPFERLVEALQPERDLSYNPLFQVKFRLENAPTETLNLPGVALRKLPQAGFNSKLDLSLDLYETTDGLVGGFEYNKALFKAETIDRISQSFINLLTEIATYSTEKTLSQLSLLSREETQKILFDWNQTEIDYPKNLLFHQLFEEQVARSPDAIALTFQDEHLTYSELNARSNQFACQLQSLGVQPESRVGICIDRSLDMIVALLAVFKAGGAYLPLDPAYPIERLVFMLEDADVSVLITQSHLQPKLPKTAAIVIAIDQSDYSHYPSDNFPCPATIDHLAYLIYTSGSTGRPKGVLVPHAGLVNLTLDKIRICDVREGDRVLQFFSFSFDASIPEIVMALGSGATLCLASSDNLLPGPALLKLLQLQRITHITITPSALAQVPYRDLPDLKMVLVGGEAPSPELIGQWGTGRIFINAYGPTETTVNASMVPCGNGHPVLPTLRPSANKQLYVLDRQLQPIAIGVIGELYIGGVGLARGYHNRPEVTAAKFLPNPWRSGKRMYQTGDLAFHLPDGRIRLVGRVDDQVKVRGFRIELPEIEAVLLEHSQVTDAIAMVREDQPGNPQVIAYVTDSNCLADSKTDAEAESLSRELRSFLRQKLPEYMVPTAIILLPTFPLTPNGKIDLKSLPTPEFKVDRTAAPRNAIETQLQTIYQTCLKLDVVGIHDDFFELGGHSLLATQLIAQTLQIFQIELTVMDLFEAPTIADLAEQIIRKQITGQSNQTIEPNLTEVEEREEFEL